ncbi:F-box only protein 15 isoform X1 [Entelurus aequoreus]|uniref:F-box only protein 15 isoform X1 n=2 Tax=Entelurus aequoreus TaxID=161455 RepID=UPI002B1D5E17|nr:F-box only protein 15 isoform X1 [Entelurus aequoreus]
MLASKRFQRGNTQSRYPQNFMERLPSEVLHKILSYLDAATLICIGHVSKSFYQLANDEALWRNIYRRLLNKKSIDMVRKMHETNRLESQARPVDSWKLHYIKTRDAWARKKWRPHLGVISHHTGLPSHTDQILRNITWELTATDRSSRETTYDLSFLRFFETSVVLCWYGNWPDYHHISTIQLHGVRRVALTCPGLKAPGWRSFMEVIDMETLTKGMQDYGQDRVIELKLLKPHIVMGLWKGQHRIAFVIITLHFHRLLERSTQGSSVWPYVDPVVQAPFDDIDPDYGLHGYHLHIVLHSSECEIMSECFPQLFCCRDQICNGLVRLAAIDGTSCRQHTPLSGDVTLPWRCEALQGQIKDRCFMTLTLLDEFNKPFWCVSSSVSMKCKERPCSLFYAAEQFLIHYQDSDGEVMMNIVQVEQQKQFFLVNLAVYVSTGKVNKYFGKDY